MAGMVATPYEDLLRLVLETGTPKADRTGTGTRRVFGHQMRFDLSAGFPLVTTKRVHLRSIAYELLWFLRGESNVSWLREHGVSHLGRVGRRATASSDPSTACSGGRGRRPTAVTSTRSPSVVEPTCARTPTRAATIVSAWNVADIRRMALAPCHAFFQFYVADGRLSCQLYQRSADLFLGVPFNIASYALLTHMVAQQVGLEVGDFVWTGGDCHVYDNHVEQVREQLSRAAVPLPDAAAARAPRRCSTTTCDDVEVDGYQHHPAIKAPVAV